MKLKALDTIHISAVKADSLRPNEEFTVSDEQGAALIKQHPDKFERLEEPASEKAESAPLNKAERAPANKASTQRKKKGKA